MVSGSLSKGSEENVRALIDSELIQLLLTTITNPNSDKFLVEICLCVVRSMYEHPFAPSELISSNASTLVYIIGTPSGGCDEFNRIILPFTSRSSITRSSDQISRMCSKYFSANLSKLKRSKEFVSIRSNSIAGTANDNAIHVVTDSGIKMFGCNVFYESIGFGYCVHYQVFFRINSMSSIDRTIFSFYSSSAMKRNIYQTS